MTKLQKMILIGMAVLMAGLLIVAGVVFATREDPKPIVGAFVPPEFDPAAQLGMPVGLDASRAYNALELADVAKVSMCANVNVENNAAQVYFTSHKENLGWMKIKILDEKGILLGESGLVRPGEYIESVTLFQTPKKSGLVTAKLLIYEPDTYLSLGSASVQIMLIP